MMERILNYMSHEITKNNPKTIKHLSRKLVTVQSQTYFNYIVKNIQKMSAFMNYSVVPQYNRKYQYT